MRFNTVKFGDIEISDEKIINFKDGILGFEELKKYTLLKNDETTPFYWLQSLEDKNIALPCMNPFEILDSYSPTIEECALSTLGKINENKLMIITTVTVPNDPSKATTNLAAPIVINTGNNEGLQYIISDNTYSIRQPVFVEVEKC